MRAAKKPVAVWAPEDIGLEAAQVGAAASRRVLERLYVPVNDIECEFVAGDSAGEMAAALARRLREADLV